MSARVRLCARARVRACDSWDLGRIDADIVVGDDGAALSGDLELEGIRRASHDGMRKESKSGVRGCE